MTSKTFANRAFLLVAVLLLTGCANTGHRPITTIDPTADLTRIKSMHVIRHAADGREINLLIANKLKAMGYHVTTDSSATVDADAVVTYVDRWWWDLSTYMAELTITIRDPKTDYPLASGNLLQTSLNRKSPEELVGEVLTNIFKQGGILQ